MQKFRPEEWFRIKVCPLCCGAYTRTRSSTGPRTPMCFPFFAVVLHMVWYTYMHTPYRTVSYHTILCLHRPLPYHAIPYDAYYQACPVLTCALCGDATLGQGTSGTWHILPSISMVNSVTCLRYAESREITERPHAPTPPVGSRRSCQPTVKLHVLPLVWILPQSGKGVWYGMVVRGRRGQQLGFALRVFPCPRLHC